MFVRSASGESLPDYLPKLLGSKRTLTKKDFEVRENFSETRKKLGSTCVKRLTKLSDEKQINGPTEKGLKKCQHQRDGLYLVHDDSIKIYQNHK